MMTSGPPRYKLLNADNEADLESRMNKLALKGYQLRHFGFRLGEENEFHAVLEFEENHVPDYFNVEEIAMVPLTLMDDEANKKLGHGWEILSHYSKHLIMVKRTVDPAKNVQPPVDEESVLDDLGGETPPDALDAEILVETRIC